MSKKANKQLRITMKTAKTLVRRVLGVSGTGLHGELWHDGMQYEMKLGELMVEVKPYRYGRNKTAISVHLTAGFDGAMRLCFEPETLEEDCEAEKAWLAEVQQERCEECGKCNAL